MPRRGGVRLTGKIRIPKGYTERKCMCCAKPFASEWIGHRLCGPCKNSSRAAVDDFGVTTTRIRIR
jgi:Zn finger protein HypA/HybF involved in hydrogenase expression